MKNRLIYQSSEYDCGPTSVTNAIRFLFERAEIPPAVLKHIWIMGIDTFSADGEPGKEGTSKASMRYMDAWLECFAENCQFPIKTAFLDMEFATVQPGSPAWRCLERGGCVVMRCSLGGDGHYVLLTRIVSQKKVGLFDPYSLRLFSTGFLAGVVLGIGTGILIGWFPKVYYWVQPVLKVTGVIPAVAWMPFALTLLPTPFWAAVFLIAICSWFPVASQAAFGIQTTPKTLFEASRTLGAKTPFLLFRVAVPNAMPHIFNGITTACAGSFTCLVMAEMMGQPGGLGYYINVVKVWAAYYKVFATILVMAILFSLILAVLNVVRAYVLRWQRGQFR